MKHTSENSIEGAFSLETASVSIHVQSVNDRPILDTGTVSLLPAIIEDVTPIQTNESRSILPRAQ